MSSFLFTLDAVLPVFLLILTGIVLRKFSIIDDNFNSRSSKLVFTVALPALVFQKISRTDFRAVFNGREILFIVLLVTGGFLLIFFMSGFFIKDGASRGAFVQGAFRSNIAIVGLAIIVNIFGDSGAARTAIALVFIFPMYNIYAVLALLIPLRKGDVHPGPVILKAIATNPLILAVIVAFPFSLFHIPTGHIVNSFIDYLARMTLPLALIGVGGALSFSSFRKGWGLALGSALIKLLFYPLVCGAILLSAGFRGEPLVVILLMLGSPSAVSSYVMADAMGSDRDLAANIILLTTLGSVLSLGLLVFVSRVMGII